LDIYYINTFALGLGMKKTALRSVPSKSNYSN
jgi:hypothetical protein